MFEKVKAKDVRIGDLIIHEANLNVVTDKITFVDKNGEDKIEIWFIGLHNCEQVQLDSNFEAYLKCDDYATIIRLNTEKAIIEGYKLNK